MILGPSGAGQNPIGSAANQHDLVLSSVGKWVSPALDPKASYRESDYPRFISCGYVSSLAPASRLGRHCESALAKAKEDRIDEVKRDWRAWECAILARRTV
jgi:hypothetical protein